MLTAKQIVDNKIVTMSSKYNHLELAPAQMGVDLHCVSIAKLLDNAGYLDFEPGVIYSDSIKDEETGKSKKAKIVKTHPCEMGTDMNGKSFWYLQPGDYEIGFAEGCNIPLNAAAIIIHRSSVRRNGAVIYSPLWDPNFHTDEMGTFMHVNVPIVIYPEARLAQMIVFESKEEAEAYNGTYQGTGVQNK